MEVTQAQFEAALTARTAVDRVGPPPPPEPCPAWAEYALVRRGFPKQNINELTREEGEHLANRSFELPPELSVNEVQESLLRALQDFRNGGDES